MTKRQKRKIAIIAVLSLLLLLLALYFAYFRATRRLDFDFTPPSAEIVEPPQYLYSFSGSDADRMQYPLGVFVDGDRVYVSDSQRRKVYVCSLEGELQQVFGEGEVVIPLYIAKNPKDGNLYISDRRRRQVLVYTTQGRFVRVFDPKLPKDQLPKFETRGAQWAPVALDFAPDGTLYVTEILRGHRLLIFGPDGKFKRSVGDAGIALQSDADPLSFQFPNGVKVFKNEVWVSDSNNRRIQIFGLNGDYKRMVVTEGLPRGFDFLARRSAATTATADKFVVVDTLAHDSTIWAEKGEKILNFGERGVLEGQFSYPNDLSVGPRNLIFITDSANARVQVWGWPDEVSPVPIPAIPPYWRWCFSPLLLLPLLLLLRKKRFVATTDFVEGMVEFDVADAMPHRKREWQVRPRDYELLKDLKQDDLEMSEVLNPTEHSESDSNALQEKLEIDENLASMLALAQRAHVFCTEDDELRRLARTLEIDVVNREEYLERFAKDRKEKPPVDDDASGGDDASITPRAEGEPEQD